MRLDQNGENVLRGRVSTDYQKQQSDIDRGEKYYKEDVEKDVSLRSLNKLWPKPCTQKTKETTFLDRTWQNKKNELFLIFEGSVNYLNTITFPCISETRREYILSFLRFYF